VLPIAAEAGFHTQRWPCIRPAGTVPSQAFVVSQAKGIWGTAQEVPGTAALNQDGLAVINAVSCGAPGYCSAGGHYTQSLGGNFGSEQAFVVNET
jgi:hypothetical protein